MADQVYLSVWIRGFTVHNMLRNFEMILKKFPFSRLDPRVLLRVYAIDMTEPAQMERLYPEGVRPAELISTARELENPDCAYEVSGFWDLWEYKDDWSLAPAPVVFTCYGPLFPSEMGEQILVDLGRDYQFLPQAHRPSSLLPARSNIRSLLHLADDIEKSVLVDKRMLWSESGENLAERLEEALAGGEG
jgi:hypothetical protein